MVFLCTRFLTIKVLFMAIKDFLSIQSSGKLMNYKGFNGSAYSMHVWQQFLSAERSLFIRMKSEEEARALVSDLALLLEKKQVLYFPGFDRLESELLPPNALTVYQRLRCLKTLIESDDNVILVGTSEAFRQSTLPPARFKELSLHFEVEDDYDYDKTVKQLIRLGYRREEMVASRGEFAIRGDIIDIFPSTEEKPYRLEFFGDELESIREFDLYSQRSGDKRTDLKVYTVIEFDREDYQLKSDADIPDEIMEFFQSQTEKNDVMELKDSDFVGMVWLNPYVKSSSLVSTYRKNWLRPSSERPDYPMDSAIYFGKDMELFISTVEQRVMDGWEVHLCLPKAGFLHRVQKILESRDLKTSKKSEFGKERTSDQICLHGIGLHQGFECREFKTAVYTYRDFTGIAYKAPKRKRKKTQVFEGNTLHHFSELNVGDYVVHSDHGIARFSGIEDMLIEGVRKEYLILQYQGTDKVYVPITEVDRISRFSEIEGRTPKLNKLDSVRWTQVKTKVKEDLQKFAGQLLEHYAKRTVASGYAFAPDNEFINELESSFEHDETPDQLNAISEIKQDLERSKPMERLLCGDVGFGKTEVAIRAAFKATQDKKQVAVLCPTTILAQQHFQTFQSRLLGLPVRVEVLNRFIGTKKTREILKDVADHKVDILIGTHRLLSKDINFDDLGLLIVDEEQRFGVRHKEKLRSIRRGVDTLTLSATPIPRTLHMSLGGARNISVIHTPPPGRLPVKTFVLPYQDHTIREAVERELKRNGQVFYVYNRVDSIQNRAEKLLKILPGIRLRYLHGQMDAKQIEEVMTAFLRREFDVLLTTTIIESGMDIPNVNTIIVEKANAFGLAQLYQLRGRIGRRESQGYAYLFYEHKDKLTDVAAKRLSALEEFTDLGSGFKIAMRDLEIRGAGNLLGKQQSGFIYNIGFDLYAKLLRGAIEKLKDSNYKEEQEMPQLDLRVNSFITEKYIPSYRQRMDLFKRLSYLKCHEALEDLKQELFDRYGPFSKQTEELFRVVELRINSHWFGVKRMQQMNQSVNIEFYTPVEPELKKQAQKHLGASVIFPTRFPSRMLIEFKRSSGTILDGLLGFFNQRRAKFWKDAKDF
jgi:transcription-repair coupling factor (superfamily II helicase)